MVLQLLCLLAFLPFDFNPLHLQNPNSEAVATYLELRHDPQTGANNMTKIVADPKQVYGGSATMLTTNFGDAGNPLFSTPPKCKACARHRNGKARCVSLPSKAWTGAPAAARMCGPPARSDPF